MNTDRPAVARAFQVLGVCLIVAGTVSVGATTLSSEAQAQNTFPLDKYPGFGRSPDAVLRDDTIAYWEAYGRERLISSCMGESGFEYVPAVAYPEEAMLAVAEGLGVAVSSDPSLESPFDRNRTYEVELTPEEREGFNQALFGESAADVAEVNRTGLLPVGRMDFATGGCVGRVKAGALSVWDLRRELDDELVVMQRSIAESPELAATRAAFRECAQRVAGIAADDPADVDAFVGGGGSEPQAATVLSECERVWAVGYRQSQLTAAAGLVKEHAVAFSELEARYSHDIMATVRNDDEFLAYLSDQVRVTDSPAEALGEAH